MEYKSADDKGTVDAKHYDKMQTELINIIKKAEMKPNKDDTTQVVSAVLKLVSERFDFVYKKLNERVEDVRVKTCTTNDFCDVLKISQVSKPAEHSGGGFLTGAKFDKEINVSVESHLIQAEGLISCRIKGYSNAIINRSSPSNHWGYCFKNNEISFEVLGIPDINPINSCPAGYWEVIKKSGKLFLRLNENLYLNNDGTFEINLYYK